MSGSSGNETKTVKFVIKVVRRLSCDKDGTIWKIQACDRKI